MTRPLAGRPGAWFLEWPRDFFLLENFQTGSVSHPAFCTCNGHQLGCEVPGAEVTYEWSYTSAPSICLNVMHWENCIVHALNFRRLYLVFYFMPMYDTASGIISIMTRLWAGWSRVCFTTGQEIFSSLKHQSNCRAHNASYSADSNIMFYVRIKQMRLEVERPLLSRVIVKNG